MTGSYGGETGLLSRRARRARRQPACLGRGEHRRQGLRRARPDAGRRESRPRTTRRLLAEVLLEPRPRDRVLLRPPDPGLRFARPGPQSSKRCRQAAAGAAAEPRVVEGVRSTAGAPARRIAVGIVVLGVAVGLRPGPPGDAPRFFAARRRGRTSSLRRLLAARTGGVSPVRPAPARWRASSPAPSPQAAATPAASSTIYCASGLRRPPRRPRKGAGDEGADRPPEEAGVNGVMSFIRGPTRALELNVGEGLPVRPVLTGRGGRAQGPPLRHLSRDAARSGPRP